MKKLREEHENLSDLMYDDYRSGSDSISSSDNIHEVRSKWHSAEDVRSRKVNYFKLFNTKKKQTFMFLDPKARGQSQKERDEKHQSTNNRQTQAMVYVYANDTISDNEQSKSKQSIDADIDKIVVENKHFRMVSINK